MKRPLSIILVSCLFIISGIAGIIYHAEELTEIFTQSQAMLVLVVRLLAIIGGLFVLRGANWARWLLVIWIVYHVVLSMYHSPMELAMHAVIMIIVIVALFNKKANAFFNKS